jgi:hypothetical protein
MLVKYEEPRSSYSSTNIIRVTRSRRMRWAGQAERMGEMRNVYNILIGRPEGMRPPGRHMHIYGWIILI